MAQRGGTQMQTDVALARDPRVPVTRIAEWGFLSNPDLPDRPGPAYLLVALRPVPTLRHYDPESIEYWVTEAGRGRQRRLTRATPMPLSEPFSWGMIRLVDRLHVTNEYLTFGGRLDAGTVDDATVVAFTSPAPLLRRGGHSQGWDAGADLVGAFFARLMVGVDYRSGFEATIADASPTARYAAFIRDAEDRRRAGRTSSTDSELGRLIRHEASRLRVDAPEAWAAGAELLAASGAD
jgi:hypothetical protein